MVSKNCPITSEHGSIIFGTKQVTIATPKPAKNTLYFSFKYLYFKNGTVNFFSNYRILVRRIRCNFWQSLKIFCTQDSEPPYKNSIVRNNFTMPFFKYKCLKLKLRVSLADYRVAMVNCFVTKMILLCSLVIGQFFDTIIVTSIDNKW